MVQRLNPLRFCFKIRLPTTPAVNKLVYYLKLNIGKTDN